MINTTTVLLALGAYLLGAIPSAVVIGKAFFNKDVRDFGSKNAGATNTFRVLGKRAGTTVLLIDIFKGATATNLVYFSELLSASENIIAAKIAFGMLAVVGHIYPIWAQFRGGKGIATLLGLVVALDPVLAFGCLIVFLIVLILSNMVSASSIIATLSFTIMTYFRYGDTELILHFFGIFAVILVLFTHRANLVRIWKGEEKKIYIFKSNKA